MWVTTLFLAAPAAHAKECDFKDIELPEGFDPKEYDGPCTPEEYDDLLDKVDDGAEVSSDPIYQLFPGTSGVVTPDGRGLPEKRGEVFTSRSTDQQPWYTEDWVLRQPEQVLMGLPTDLSYTGMGQLAGALPYYKSLPNASEYGILTFVFQYKRPPKKEDIAQLKYTVPLWVTPLKFKVYTVKSGVKEESGALYRERGNFGGVVDWRDTWMLWDNYIAPSPDYPDVHTELERVSNAGTRRAFLEDQVDNHPDSTYVCTERERIWPLP